MKLLIWKKAAVLGLLFSMTMSLTACGEKKENNGLNSENSNLDCFFSSEDIDMSAVKGSLAINTKPFVVEGDKVYFFTCEDSGKDNSGNVPDILYLMGMPVERYAAKGVLEDLNPYLDKDDVVKKDDIVPSVLKAMQTDGKLYYIATGSMVYSVMAKKEDVGDRTGWTVEEFKALLDEKGEGVRPLLKDNKTEVLESLMRACANDYIDWNKGECRFNGESFKSLLEIAGRGNDEETDYDSMNYIDDIRSGNVLLDDFLCLTPSDMQISKKVFDCDVTLIGYPCEDKKGSYFDLYNKIGIYSQSKVKDGAWEFLRTLMTKDYQLSDEYCYWGFCPTNIDAFESYMKTQTATEPYTDEYGRSITPNYMNAFSEGDVQIDYSPLSPDEEKLYRDLVNTTTKIRGDNEEVVNIICEEAGAYFAGQKSLDETADIIQNRVTNYVNEIR